MSDAHNADDHAHESAHEGPIKTPKQLVLAVVFSFLVPIVVIILLVSFVSSEHKPAAGSEGLTDQAIAQRVMPVGHVEIKDPTDLSTMKTGEQVFAAQCVNCHGAGVLGAPKLGDAAAWGSRVKGGYEALLTSALKGKGNMGPQGGGDFSDLEIGRAVVYMANKGGAKFEEPKAAVAKNDAAASAAAGGVSTRAAEQAVAAAVAMVSASAPEAKGSGASAEPPALYAQACSTCHATGVAGAPKVGDKAAWAPRVGQGIDGLVASAIKGKGAMPPKGGTSASEADIKGVVTYMVGASK